MPCDRLSHVPAGLIPEAIECIPSAIRRRRRFSYESLPSKVYAAPYENTHDTTDGSEGSNHGRGEAEAGGQDGERKGFCRILFSDEVESAGQGPPALQQVRPAEHQRPRLPNARRVQAAAGRSAGRGAGAESRMRGKLIPITLRGFQCERCGWKWVPRGPAANVGICPKCKSLLWDTPKPKRTTKGGTR